VTDLIEAITRETTQPRGRHEHLAGHEGEIAVRAWLGSPADPHTQIGDVGWIRAVEWMPFQLKTFVTPPFPGIPRVTTAPTVVRRTGWRESCSGKGRTGRVAILEVAEATKRRESGRREAGGVGEIIILYEKVNPP